MITTHSIRRTWAIASMLLAALATSAAAAPPEVPEPPPGCTPPTEGRVALWRGEDSAEDSVGANHGALPAGGGFEPGIVGGALDLAGSDDHLAVPAAAALDLTGDLTLDIWVRLDDVNFGHPDAYGVGGDRMIFWKTDQQATGAATYTLWIEGDSGASALAAPLRFAAGSDYGASYVESQDLAWAADTWYHVAATRSGDTVTLYRDGRTVGSATIAQPAVATPGAPLAVGAAPEQNTIYSPIAGALDEIGVWNRALSAAEIDELFETATGACYDPPEPDTSFTSPPAAFTTDSTPTFEFTSTIEGSTFECSVDGAPVAVCTSPHTTEPLVDGRHTFSVRAVKRPPDRAMRRADGEEPEQGVDPEPAVVEFEVDAPDPPPPPAPLTARLNITPNPTCVGGTVYWDARASSGPSAIVRYEWQFSYYPGRQQFGTFGGAVGHKTGAPWSTVTHEGLLAMDPDWIYLKHGFFRPDIDVNLTVVAADGSRAATKGTLVFTQKGPGGSTEGCVWAGVLLHQPALSARTATAKGSVLATTIDCSNHAGCSGTVEATVSSTGLRKAFASRRIVLARRAFSIRRAGPVAVRMKLDKRARSLIRRLKKPRLTLTVTTRTPDGSALVRRTAVRLRRAR